jgi:tape measure domain-containing protein
MATIASLSVSLTATTGQFAKGLNQGVGLLHKFTARVENTGAGMLRFAGAIGVAAGAIFGLRSLGDIVGTGAQLAMDFEQAEVALTTMFKSAETAKTVLTDLKAFAATSPFEMPELMQTTKQLAAYGVSADQLLPTLKMLGTIAAGSGANIGDLAYQYGTAKAQQTLFTKDLNQLANVGIPIWDILAKQFGVTTGALRTMVEGGKVSFADMQRAMLSMTSAGGIYEGMIEAQNKTVAGSFANLKDVVSLALADTATAIFKAFNAPELIKNISALASAFTSVLIPRVTEFVQSLAGAGEAGATASSTLLGVLRGVGVGIGVVLDVVELFKSAFKGAQLAGVLAFKAITDGAIISMNAMIATINLMAKMSGSDAVVKSNGILESLSKGLAEDAAKLKQEMGSAFNNFLTGANADKSARFFDDVTKAAQKSATAVGEGAGVAAVEIEGTSNAWEGLLQTWQPATESQRLIESLRAQSDAASGVTDAMSKTADPGQFKGVNLMFTDVRGLTNMNEEADPQVQQLVTMNQTLARIQENTSNGGLA